MNAFIVYDHCPILAQYNDRVDESPKALPRRYYVILSNEPQRTLYFDLILAITIYAFMRFKVSLLGYEHHNIMGMDDVNEWSNKM